jgi:uncharacterized protein (DUF362 family)
LDGGFDIMKNSTTDITRRESLKRLARIGGLLSVCGITGGVRAWGAESGAPQGFLVEGVGTTPGYEVKDLVRKVFDEAGGMKRFVSRGDVVAIKPNLSWARRPELAATTHPEVLEAVVLLCQDAGAKTVRIVDHTIHDARRCFTLSGAGQVAQRTGADLVFPRSSLMRDMRIRGERLDVWPVFTPLVEADCLINLPIAKTHGLSTLTVGMKNWIGGVGGRRYALHQDIHQTIVDLAQFFRPTLTLVDGIRVLIRNGPSGGSPEDVAARDTLILSDDPVAADARAAGLFNLDAASVGAVRLAAQQGLGVADGKTLDTRRVTL